MSGQDILSLIIVAMAITYLVWHFRRTKDSSCGSDCACDDKISSKSPQKH